MDPTGVGPSLGFMKVPESKTVKNRVHLDLTTETSLEEEVERLVAAGARIVTTLQDPNEGYVDPHIWTVMQDPEGNEFCVLEPLNRRPASERGAAPCSVQRSPVLLRRESSTAGSRQTIQVFFGGWRSRTGGLRTCIGGG